MRVRSVAMSYKQSSLWYPIALPLRFESVGQISVKGVGGTIEIQSKAVRFVTDQDLKAGLKLRLTISWPAQLADGTGLNLAMSGIIARSELGAVELLVSRHEFRTRRNPLQRAAGGS